MISYRLVLMVIEGFKILHLVRAAEVSLACREKYHVSQNK